MPDFQRSVSGAVAVAVAVSLAKYVRITFIRKNSVVCVKNNVFRFRNFAVAVHPFI